MSNLFRNQPPPPPRDAAPDTAPDADREQDTPEFESASERTATHDLTESVTAADYLANTDTKTVGDMTVPALAFAATGASTGDRDVSDGERAQYARRIDEGVRGYMSWLQGRPVDERVMLADRPVIHVPDE